MKTKSTLKFTGLLVATAILATGCASTEDEAEAPAPEPAAVEAAPAAEPAPAPEPAPEPAQAANDQYEVVSGDNLWNIAGKQDIYSNPYQWPLIYKANQAQIKDADLIYPGQSFEINRNASGAEVDAAITHAKTRGAWSLGVVEESDKAYLAQ